MKDGLNFIAIDFETATPKRASICEVGICVVRNGEVVETRSWLVQPEENLYSYWNMQCHGIRPEDTESAPSFPEVWEEIERLYLDEFDTFVAHNAPFDRSCLEHSAKLYRLHLPEIIWQCSLKTARQVYYFGCNTLGYLFLKHPDNLGNQIAVCQHFKKNLRRDIIGEVAYYGKRLMIEILCGVEFQKITFNNSALQRLKMDLQIVDRFVVNFNNRSFVTRIGEQEAGQHAHSRANFKHFCYATGL